ncbi:MAG: low molecular weight protein arginine phosphatase [Clostridia bacterium]|nr:low molecular weight protein arginine phosphatase [Clostridia bacterium]
MRVLFVCTGNTCRSFMAEQLMEELIDDASDDDRLQKGEIKVSSAGLFAVEGDEASDFAVKALDKLYNIDCDRHKARQLDEEVIEDADLILTMTDSQKHAIADAYEDFEDKVFTLKEFAIGPAGDEDENIDVDDPYGGELEEYMACAEEIKALVDITFEKIIAMEN